MNFLKQPSKRISNPSITAEIKEAQTSFHERQASKPNFSSSKVITHTHTYHKLLMVKIHQRKCMFKADSMYSDRTRHTRHLTRDRCTGHKTSMYNHTTGKDQA